jgi:hypothetical protein
MLRIFLFGLSKHRIQPERYAKLRLKYIDNKLYKEYNKEMYIIGLLPEFNFFDNLNTFLIEMKYNYYIKELQAEINMDKNLFPTKEYFLSLSELSKINDHKIKNGYVYFLASENLEYFKLFNSDDSIIINTQNFIPINEKIFSLLYLPYYTIKSSLRKYTNARKELYRLSQVHSDLIGFSEDILMDIAIFLILDIMNNREQINEEKQQIIPILKKLNWKNMGIKYISKENKNGEIIWKDNWDNLIVVEFNNDYEFNSFSIISKEIFLNEFEYDIQNDGSFINTSIMNYGVKYNKNDFIDLENKYLEMFKE